MTRGPKLNRSALTDFINQSGYKSRSELARDVGITPGSLCDLETGRRRPSPSTLGALAKSLGVRKASLLADPEDEAS